MIEKMNQWGEGGEGGGTTPSGPQTLGLDNMLAGEKGPSRERRSGGMARTSSKGCGLTQLGHTQTNLFVDEGGPESGKSPEKGQELSREKKALGYKRWPEVRRGAGAQVDKESRRGSYQSGRAPGRSRRGRSAQRRWPGWRWFRRTRTESTRAELS